MIVLILSAPSLLPRDLLFPPYYSLFIAPCLSSSLTVQLGSSSAYRVGQAVRLQWRLWWGGLLWAPEQWCSAGRGEEEQQEATFLHLSYHVPQTHASSSPPAPLHGNQRAGPHQLQQPHSSGPNWRDQRGAFLQRTFTGKILHRKGEAAAAFQVPSSICRLNRERSFAEVCSMTNKLHLAFYRMFSLSFFSNLQQYAHYVAYSPFSVRFLAFFNPMYWVWWPADLSMSCSVVLNCKPGGEKDTIHNLATGVQLQLFLFSRDVCCFSKAPLSFCQQLGWLAFSPSYQTGLCSIQAFEIMDAWLHSSAKTTPAQPSRFPHQSWHDRNSQLLYGCQQLEIGFDLVLDCQNNRH